MANIKDAFVRRKIEVGKKNPTANDAKTTAAPIVDGRADQKERERQRAYSAIRDNWSSGRDDGEPVDGRTYRADGWFFVHTVGTVRYDTLRNAIRDYTDGSVVIPALVDISGTITDADSINDTKKLEVLHIMAARDRRKLDSVEAAAVMCASPEIAARFDSDPNFYAVPMNWTPPEKLN